MRIGIDIDDVITDTSSSIRKYIDKSDNKGHIYNHIEEVMRGEMPTQEIKNFYKDNSINIFRDAEVKKDASGVIKNLMDEGNEVFIITSRGEVKFSGSEQLTLDYLKAHNINYTKIIFKENSIDLMVDDSVKFCVDIVNNNMKSILFTSVVNKNEIVEVPRVSSWLELQKELENITK
mgnify:CR=1 FL=1